MRPASERATSALTQQLHRRQRYPSETTLASPGSAAIECQRVDSSCTDPRRARPAARRVGVDVDGRARARHPRRGGAQRPPGPAPARRGRDDRRRRRRAARPAGSSPTRAAACSRRARRGSTSSATVHDDWDGRWLVVLCSVPEDQRAKRHQLRNALGFAGFGFLARAWRSVRTSTARTRPTRVLTELGLVPGAVVFRAETGSLVEPDELLGRAWDLDRPRRRVHGGSSTPSAAGEPARRRRPVRRARRARPRVAAVSPDRPGDPAAAAPRPLAAGAAKALFDARHDGVGAAGQERGTSRSNPRQLLDVTATSCSM